MTTDRDTLAADQMRAELVVLASQCYYGDGDDRQLSAGKFIQKLLAPGGWLAEHDKAVAAKARTDAEEAVIAALKRDANPEIWWFIGEAVNRVRQAIDGLRAARATTDGEGPT